MLESWESGSIPLWRTMIQQTVLKRSTTEHPTLSGSGDALGPDIHRPGQKRVDRFPMRADEELSLGLNASANLSRPERAAEARPLFTSIAAIT
jgi:hypothetical protein